MSTGQKIKKHRIIKKVSPKDIASLLDIDVSNYYKIERDEVKADIDKLVKISTALDVELKELLPEDKYTFNINQNNATNCNGYVNNLYAKEADALLLTISENLAKTTQALADLVIILKKNT